MSARCTGSRDAERHRGRGTRGLAPFVERSPPTQVRSNTLPDPDGGMHGLAHDEQGTPRTEGRARRSAFRGIDGTPGRDRVSGSGGAVSNDGRLECGPAREPGFSAAVPGARSANRPRRVPAVGRKRLRTPYIRGRSNVWVFLREVKTRYPRTRIARDSSRYQERDCQAAFFSALAGAARHKRDGAAVLLQPVEKTALSSRRSISLPRSGTGSGAPERRIIARDNCFGIPGLAGGFRRPSHGAGPHRPARHHKPAPTAAHCCRRQSRCCSRASCAIPLRRASSLSP